MLEERCNIWDKYDQGYTICITTNGYVKTNGRAVMGRGVAKQAVSKIPNLDKTLGQAIASEGNRVQRIVNNIVSFPVKAIAGQCNPDRLNVIPHMRKRFKAYDFVPGWALKADIHIIERSLWELNTLHYNGFFRQVYLPRPGCGAGCLNWQQVKRYCEQYGDWLIVCDL